MCYLCTALLKGTPLLSPDGGIGRRAGLKHQWGNPCRFDPGSGYTAQKAISFVNNLFAKEFFSL